MTSVLRYVLVGGILLGGAMPVQAQEGVSSKSTVQQVEEHNQKGLAHYEKGEFPEAIEHVQAPTMMLRNPGDGHVQEAECDLLAEISLGVPSR